jgi:hypothetical protein
VRPDACAESAHVNLASLKLNLCPGAASSSQVFESDLAKRAYGFAGKDESAFLHAHEGISVLGVQIAPILLARRQERA